MRHNNFRTPEQVAELKAEIIRLHTELDYGLTAISLRTKTDKGLIAKWLKKAGVYKTGHRTAARLTRTGMRLKSAIRLMSKEFKKETHFVKIKEDNGWSSYWYRVSKYNLACGVKYKLKCRARSRVKNALKQRGLINPFKSISKVVGCTTDFLAKHIESKFRDGMTWGNHGTVWELDHIYPLARLDLSDPEQMKRGCHWTNLQPLLNHENRRKRDWLTPPPRPLSLDTPKLKFKVQVTKGEFKN